ncbi:hypothetical protein BCF46_3776 [Litoreibacter meonggei]|uniref:Uncharacterized protein n=1 Tax=Litoreibacter meonggei TaxID=1049199 RepID=A0A497V6H3_9RHOB|nr:hypothetical protein [Litoreibacter meonggei]RLJ36308.1 hypothetical protein BCF46_3776 [Litoreibacter meonggei]
MSLGDTEIWESHDANPLLWLTVAALAFVAHLALLQAGIAAYQAQVSGASDPGPETKIFASALQIAGEEIRPPQLAAERVTPTAPSQPTSQTLSATVATAPTLPAAIADIAPASKQPLNQPGVAPLRNTPMAQADVVASGETLEIATMEVPTVTGTEPVLEVVAEPEPVEAPTPLSPVANSLPPQPGTLTKEKSGVASASVPNESAEQAQDIYNSVLNFLRSFDGGPCFAALPVLAEDGAFRFETFANSRADLTRFRQAIEIETGTLPGTVMKPVSDAQCQALPFVTAAARYPEFQLYLDLVTRDIPSGELLSGKLGNTSGGFVSLLLIDDEGVVQDLGSFLKFRAGFAGFDIPMTLKGSPVETQQLLMALSTRARLKTLQSLSGQHAKDFFQRLAVEILLQGGGEDMALVAFSVR